MEKKKSLRFLAWMVPALFCIVYGIIVASVRSGTAFFLVWFVLGAFFCVLAADSRYHFRQKMPRPLRIGLRIVFCFLLVSFLITEGMIVSRFGEKGRPELDCIIVLGSQVHKDGPSAVLRYRLDTAAAYLEQNPRTICIVSGGQGANEPFPEADGMAEYLQEKGIPAERIVREAESRTTEENLRFCRRLTGEDSSVGLVTNNFHLFRALRIADKEGYRNVCGIAADSTPLYLPNNMLREYFAVLLSLVKP